MLNPNNDRLDYGQVLAPPAGYKFDFAVATTYSLDLDALVGACIALGLSEETDSDLMQNPICLLEALRSTEDKLTLFCEAGQIHIPGNVTALYILLEKMVFQVVTAKKKGITSYPSFHPKFWMIRYKSDCGEPLFRLIVLSRNLTFDRSWDVTFYMDGVKGKETDKNIPLEDFLTYLTKQLPASDVGKEKNKKIKALIRELHTVQFSTGMKEFYDYEFIPNGVKRQSGGFYSIQDQPLFNDTFHEALIISPFLSNDIIKDFNNRNTNIEKPEMLLITRAMSLERLKPDDCNHFNIYTMKDAVIDGESAISEEQEIYQKQDIHAKTFMIRKYANTDLYVGSLNASHNAVYGNIEVMLRLKSKNRYLNLNQLKDELFKGDEFGVDNPFQPAKLPTDGVVEADPMSELDIAIKEISRLAPYAVISTNGEFYDISVHFGVYECDLDITVCPLLSKTVKRYSENVLFKKLSLSNLSEFYILMVREGDNRLKRVIKINTEGMPENREKEVISSVVSNEQSFYRYIAFLLGDDYILSALESNNINGVSRSGITTKVGMQMPVIYEKMLQTAACAPERLKNIDNLINAISEDGIIPEGFKELYNTFKRVVK